MPARPVVRLPDPVLKTPCAPVARLDADALDLARDLLDTMRLSAHCVGLAANQIGVSRRVFVADVSGHPKARSCHGEIVLFNPVLVSAEAPEHAREGCMSVPDLTGDVPRATRVVVRGMAPDGSQRIIEADAFEARAILHELDHLDGHLFLDRVASEEAVFRRKVYR